MVNTKDPRFRKNDVKRGIQLLCRGKIVSKRLFNNHPCILHAARACERLDNIDKKIGRNRQIVNRTDCWAQRLLQPIKGRDLLIITTDVVKQVQQLGQCLLIGASTLLVDAVASALFQMLISSPGLATPIIGKSSDRTEPYGGAGKDLLVCRVPHRPNKTKASAGLVSSGFASCDQSEIGINMPHLLLSPEAEQSWQSQVIAANTEHETRNTNTEH
jgi:hypothetical protein